LSQLGDQDDAILSRGLQIFGDKLYIKHAPIIVQQGLAQSVLLTVGYLYRTKPKVLRTLSRSTAHLSAVSNRLAAPSELSRILGMIVAECVSTLVDSPDRRMKWDMTLMQTPETNWYKTLIEVCDVAQYQPDLEFDLSQKSLSGARLVNKDLHVAKIDKLKIEKEASNPYNIEEITDTIASRNARKQSRLQPYSKPDSDPEDEDEDPTLTQRKKSTAPVYIRDLISSLQASDDYEKLALAMKTAPELIRRKTSFGTEIKDHAEELAGTLCALKDTFDMKHFEELRLQAMIALFCSLPEIIGPFYAATVFSGDFSQGQRNSILTAIGFGTREVAGYGELDSKLTGFKGSKEKFPTKRLPANIESVYEGTSQKMNALIGGLEKQMIEPRALAAADRVSGPNILKVRTFSSRLKNDKIKPITPPNAVGAIIARSIFFPLTGGWYSHLKAYSGQSVHFQSFLLVTFLRTLALVMHAAGPSSTYLRQMTSELWDLLLSLRSQNDVVVLEAILFALLTMLEVNERKEDLVVDHPKELSETQDWAGAIFDSPAATNSGLKDENERLRMLTANLLVELNEIMEKYQQMLLGSLMK
jgi:telomere length regulation protein